jgi:transposase InsO family protein
MEKHEVRKEFFKLKIKGHSYNQCRKILFTQFGYEITSRTLQRWNERLNKTEWDLKDASKRPKTIHVKITSETEKKIINLRKKTGFGEYKLIDYFNLGHTSIYKILNKNNLTIHPEKRRKRIKYIRWQRKHPNSLWQIDHTDEQEKGYYTLSVIDDCSRYSLTLSRINFASTEVIVHILDELIKKHGKPREILSDNGSCFGGKSKHSKFDIWCRRRGIKHIRSAIHSPTTTGKVERLFQTMDKELEFCNGNSELFRMRYNHFRPHASLENKTPAEIYFAFDKLF